jgi:hypothetical protein
MLQCTKVIRGEKERTFVLKEIAHPGATGQDELSHILDNLGFLLRRESRKPFGKTLDRSKFASVKELWDQVKEPGGPRGIPLCLAATTGLGN